MLTQTSVDAVKEMAAKLGARGNLAIISVGSQVDPTSNLLPQLTDSYFIWRDPKEVAVPIGWEDFFWNQAYGCEGNPPSDAPTPGTEATITFPIIPTTQPPPSKPCEGRIALFLDTSKTLSESNFNVKVLLAKKIKNFRIKKNLLEENFFRILNSTTMSD